MATRLPRSAKVHDRIELESRNRFFRRNVGYVIAGFVMTAAVVVGVIKFGGLQDQDISILFGMGFGGFMLGMFVVPMLQSLFSDAKFHILVRIAMSLAFFAVFFSIRDQLHRGGRSARASVARCPRSSRR